MEILYLIITVDKWHRFFFTARKIDELLRFLINVDDFIRTFQIRMNI
jgi:hypothetical protein